MKTNLFLSWLAAGMLLAGMAGAQEADPAALVASNVDRAADSWEVRSGLVVTEDVREILSEEALAVSRPRFAPRAAPPEDLGGATERATVAYLDNVYVTDGRKQPFGVHMRRELGFGVNPIAAFTVRLGGLRQLPTLLVVSNSASAALKINGRSVARTPGDIYLVQAGLVDLLMTEAGRIPCNKRLRISVSAQNRAECRF